MDFRPRILVAESDPSLRRLLTTTMKHMGAEAVCAESHEEARSRLTCEKFDGVFLDWDDPAFRAEELTLEVRKSKSNPGIPIAMLSAHPQRADVVRGFKAGSTFYLAKPFGSRELEFLLNATRGAMLEERRRYQRISASLPVLCEWREGAKSRHVAGRSINVSITGILIRVNPRPEPGVSVKLEVSLPHPCPKLAVSAMVVRTGMGDNVGLRFLNLTREQQEQLEHFVTACPSSTLFTGA
jgi:CheY-like chemotaxis protein